MKPDEISPRAMPDEVPTLTAADVAGHNIAGGPDSPANLQGWARRYFPAEYHARVRRTIGRAMRERDPDALTDAASIYRLCERDPAAAADCWNRAMNLLNYDNGFDEPLA